MIKVNCQYCDKEFRTYLHEIKKNNGKYCCRKCFRESLKGKKHTKEHNIKIGEGGKGKTAGTKHYNWKGGKVDRNCLVCNKKIKILPSEIRRGGGKYCCRECEGVAKTGINSPCWLGGKSFEPYSSKWTEKLREEIRERDSRTCQLCGKTETQELLDLRQKLPVHHIDYNKKNCNKENLITLCLSCNNKVNFQRGYWMGYFYRELGIKIIYKQTDLF